MDQDPKTQLALLSAKHGCLRKQLDEANVKVTELTAEVIQLKDHNKKLQEDSAELKVYREVIEPGLHRKCKEDEEKLAATEAKLRDTESKLREEQAKVQKLYRREKIMATNQVANVQMSSVKHEAVSVIQHSATAAVDPSAQSGPPEDNNATTGPRIASPSVSTSNDAPRPPSGTAPSYPNSRVEQSNAQRPDSTQQLMNVPINVTEVGSAAGDITNAEDENLIADASRPQSPVLGPPRGVLEIEREEEEDMKRSEVQEELELNTTQELAVSSTTGAQSPATSKKRGHAQVLLIVNVVNSFIPVLSRNPAHEARFQESANPLNAARGQAAECPLTATHKRLDNTREALLRPNLAPSTSPAVTSIGLTVSPRKPMTIVAQLAYAGRAKKADAKKSPGKEPTMFSSSDLLRFVPAESDEWEDYHWKGRKCPHARCPGPDGSRLQWVACDRCEVFFHCVCVSGKNNAWPKQKSFVCDRCKE
ncbi:hypothetical protein AAVH_32737 [Aphelenchoides avenae]|nr:hypothetical protein AAVH_32737 [Aphelenchus avenae]